MSLKGELRYWYTVLCPSACKIILQGFDHHVKCEHSMWDYIYFYLHLERIDVSDHNAIESYAYHQVASNVICNMLSTLHILQIKDEKSDFFPLFHAKSLKVAPDETLTQLNELKEMVAEILERFHREVLLIIMKNLKIAS